MAGWARSLGPSSLLEGNDTSLLHFPSAFLFYSVLITLLSVTPPAGL